MNTNTDSVFGRIKVRILKSTVGRLFIDRKFAYYTGVGIFFAVLNIFLLWLLIDVLQISTVLASTLVVGATFVLRYVLFRLLGMM